MSRERRKMHWLHDGSIACKQRRGRDDATSTLATWQAAWEQRCPACASWLFCRPRSYFDQQQEQE